MLMLRFFSPILFSLVLLLAQQGSVLHALRHTLAEQLQQEKNQTSHAPADCEQCTSFAQLGSALNSGNFSFELHSSVAQTLNQQHYHFHSQHSLQAIARGPPVSPVAN